MNVKEEDGVSGSRNGIVCDALCMDRSSAYREDIVWTVLDIRTDRKAFGDQCLLQRALGL